jgi:4-amino-4-deoxy-L-arabinose transferase-like glycosyltransferase
VHVNSTAQCQDAPDGDLRRYALPLAWLVLIAALVRVYAWSNTAVLFNDGPVFLAIADAIGEGRWAAVFSHPYHPLYPLLIHVVSTTGLSGESSAIVVSIFGALIGIVSLHVFLRRTLGAEIAWLGAWLLVLHPWAVDFSSDVMSDGLYMGFYLFAFTAMARMVEFSSVKAAWACGAGSALAYLVRPEGLGLIVIGMLLLTARMWLDRSFGWRSASAMAALAVAAAVVMAPYVFALSWDAGQLTLTQKKSIGALASGQPLPPSATESPVITDPPTSEIWLPESVASAGAGRPARDFGGVLETLSRVVRTSAAALRYEVLLFVVIGCCVLRDRPIDVWRVGTIGLPIALYSGLLVLLVWGAGYVSRRHALPVWIPLLGLAALGWQTVGRSIAEQWEGRSGRGESLSETARRRIICASLVLLLALVWVPRDMRVRRGDRIALRTAAEWIARTQPSEGSVAAEKLRLAYYAQAAYVPLVARQGETLETSLRRAGTKWVVVDESRLGRIPGLEAGIGLWLTEIHRVEQEDRRALVLAMAIKPAS